MTTVVLSLMAAFFLAAGVTLVTLAATGTLPAASFAIGLSAMIGLLVTVTAERFLHHATPDR